MVLLSPVGSNRAMAHARTDPAPSIPTDTLSGLDAMLISGLRTGCTEPVQSPYFTIPALNLFDSSCCCHIRQVTVWIVSLARSLTSVAASLLWMSRFTSFHWCECSLSIDWVFRCLICMLCCACVSYYGVHPFLIWYFPNFCFTAPGFYNFVFFKRP